MKSQTMQVRSPSKQFWVLFGLGWLGVASLIPVLGTTIARQLAQLPDPPNIPLPLITILSLIQPSILLAICVVIGIFCSPKLNLRSHLVEKLVNQTAFLPLLSFTWKPLIHTSHLYG